jgi:ferric enterobactin receptor
MIKYIFLLLGFNVYCQETLIHGFVKTQGIAVPDALVQIVDKNKTTTAITSELGSFEFKKYQKQSDTLLFTVSKMGFLAFKKVVLANEPLDNINFILLKDSINQLEEVTIVDQKSTAKSGKMVYKINSKDFIKNAKSDVALLSLPNVSIQSGSVMVDNRKKAMIFIDGVESSIDELKRLDIKEVTTIAVISNPSASFGSENLGSVIQLITKKKSEKFIKAEIEAYKSIRLGLWGILPALAFKTKHVIFKSFYSYGVNNQNIENQLTRVENNTAFNQYNDRKVQGWQDYFSSRIKLILNPKSSINLSGNLFSYTFNGKSNGYYNNLVTKNFSIDDLEKLSKWSLSSIYNYSFSPKGNLFVKFKYFDYKNNDQSLYTENNGTPILTAIYSNSKETSGEIVFEKKSAQLFKLPFDYELGYKNIFRVFDFQSNQFNFNQSIHSFYINTDIEFNSKLSLFCSLTTDFTTNDRLNQTYTSLLPSFSGLYKANDKVTINLDYSRKITRPSGNYLNPEVIFYNPSLRLQGNINLLPEIRDLYEISLTKQLKNEASISVKLFNDYTKNAIIETFTNQNSVITNTYDNVGKVAIYGASLGVNAKMFKILSLNLNTGISYNNYFSNSTSALIKENKGYSFNNNLNLNISIKQKISIALNANYNTPNYSLTSKKITQPLLSFDAESTFFKEKLNVRLSYLDMFGLSTTSNDKIAYNNFSQNINLSNKMTNVSLTLVYNFGKKFSDRFNNPVINNDDIKVK